MSNVENVSIQQKNDYLCSISRTSRKIAFCDCSGGEGVEGSESNISVGFSFLVKDDLSFNSSNEVVGVRKDSNIFCGLFSSSGLGLGTISGRPRKTDDAEPSRQGGCRLSLAALLLLDTKGDLGK